MYVGQILSDLLFLTSIIITDELNYLIGKGLKKKSFYSHLVTPDT